MNLRDVHLTPEQELKAEELATTLPQYFAVTVAREIVELRDRVRELEEDHQVRCRECGWHGLHGPACSRRV
jgi:hypothetical protein